MEGRSSRRATVNRAPSGVTSPDSSANASAADGGSGTSSSPAVARETIRSVIGAPRWGMIARVSAIPGPPPPRSGAPSGSETRPNARPASGCRQHREEAVLEVRLRPAGDVEEAHVLEADHEDDPHLSSQVVVGRELYAAISKLAATSARMSAGARFWLTTETTFDTVATVTALSLASRPRWTCSGAHGVASSSFSPMQKE